MSASEYCLSVKGVVRRRPEGTENPNLKTGDFEVAATEIEILNPAKTPPFPIAEDKDVDEMVRLKYRYLDLRRPAMYEKMRLRHEAIRLIREFMYGRGFLEIETPDHDQVVAGRRARLPGPLSPRAGPVLRPAAGPAAVQAAADGRRASSAISRSPSASATKPSAPTASRSSRSSTWRCRSSTQDDVLEVVESLYSQVIPQISSKTLVTPFTRLTYDEAMARYGSDKPDLRYGLELKDAAPVLEGHAVHRLPERARQRRAGQADPLPAGRVALAQGD